ncbi:hypothetical protein ACFO4O_13240 [Glaciecola siphonariae]|uniref:Lipoprotein n=1 Tax=Glaciecola siphonariae TaxID=521012 RepID=A0ABV9LX40_9ALTE
MKASITRFSATAFLGLSFTLGGCMSKGVEMTDQQQRMARCDQYVDMSRDQCLRGENVTIDDYKEEYKDFEKDVRNKMKAETEQAQKAAAAEEKLKAEKLKEALEKAKAQADKARQAQIEAQIQAIEDSSKD